MVQAGTTPLMNGEAQTIQSATSDGLSNAILRHAFVSWTKAS